LVKPRPPSTPIRSPRSSSADHNLNRLGPVANLKERDLPLASFEHDPPGDPDRWTSGFGARFGRLGQKNLTDVVDGLMVVEPLAPRVEAKALDPPKLFQSSGFQRIRRFFRHHQALRASVAIEADLSQNLRQSGFKVNANRKPRADFEFIRDLVLESSKPARISSHFQS
jgi:hypothetical protein